MIIITGRNSSHAARAVVLAAIAEKAGLPATAKSWRDYAANTAASST